MRKYGIAWACAVAAVAAALAVAWHRGEWTRPPAAVPGTGELTARALTLLESDPGAWELSTQNAVRAAAAALVASNPASAGEHFVLAAQYERESNLAGAEAHLRKAIQADPQWAAPCASLGSLLGRQMVGRAGEARDFLARAIALKPQWGRPHNLLAIVLRSEGRTEEAEQEALEAIRLDPGDTASHNNYANLLVQQKRYEEAEKEYRVAASANPNHAKPYYNLACLYSLMGKKEEALKDLREALNRAPSLRTQASADKDFEAIRETAEFQKMVYGEIFAE